MKNAYAYWQAALGGDRSSAVVDDPQCGFYRMKRGTIWVPVAVYPTGAVLGFKIGREVVDPNMGVELWPRYCANPISEAVYRAVAEKGANWPDADPTVAAMVAPKPTADATKQPSDAADDLREQITVAVAGITVYQKIETDEASARAAGLRNMLMGLRSQADKARVDEKAPHLKAATAVDAKWQPLVKAADSAAVSLRTAMEGWENHKRQAQRQAEFRAAEEQRQREASAEKDDISAPPPEPVKPASNLPPPVAQVKPTFGKAAGVTAYQHVTKIDAAVVFESFKAHPEVIALLTALAQKSVNAGIIIPGVTTEERTKIK